MAPFCPVCGQKVKTIPVVKAPVVQSGSGVAKRWRIKRIRPVGACGIVLFIVARVLIAIGGASHAAPQSAQAVPLVVPFPRTESERVLATLLKPKTPMTRPARDPFTSASVAPMTQPALQFQPTSRPATRTERPFIFQPPLVLRNDEQAGVILRLAEVVFDTPSVGHPFSGHFRVRNPGASYQVPRDVTGPSFGVFIRRGDNLLFRNFGTWGSSFPNTGILTMTWSTERVRPDGQRVGGLIVPEPGEYRCTVELYAGNTRQRVLDHAEGTVVVR